MKGACDTFFNPHFGYPDMTYIHSFAVDPDFQRKRIGKGLLLCAMEKSREMGYARITVGTSESNYASIGAYKSLGFVEVSSELSVGMDILECDL